MLIRKSPILALAAITCCLTTGAQSGGGMTQPMPAAVSGGTGSLPVENEEQKPFADDDLSEEAEAWRAEHGKTSPAPLSTTGEPEGGGASAISAGVELGGGNDHRTAAQREKDETPEEKAKRLEPAPTHFGHRLQSND